MQEGFLREMVEFLDDMENEEVDCYDYYVHVFFQVPIVGDAIINEAPKKAFLCLDREIIVINA